jgi:flagellar FliL protein
MADTDADAATLAAPEADPAATAAPADPGAAPKKRGKGPIVAALVVALVAAGAGGGWWWWWSQAKRKQAEEDEAKLENRLKAQLAYRKENKPPVFVPMDELIVNLPGRGGESYLQAKIVLRAADGSVEGRLKQFMPLVRDRVITVLSSRPKDQLATVEGKQMLAKEVALVINAIIEPQLTAIYVLQQEPTTADLRNLERLGAMPRETSAGERVGAAAREAAAQFWRVTEMDLPVQQVLFGSFVMQ